MPEAKTQSGRRDKQKTLVILTRSRSFRALYCFGKILGVNPLRLTDRNELEFSYIGLVYGCFLGSLCCYIFYSATKHRVTLLLPGETPIAVIVDFMGIALRFLEAALTLFVFAIYQNRMKIVADSFMAADRTSRTLGILDNYQKHFGVFATYVTVSNILNFTMLIYSETMWSQIHPYETLIWWIMNLKSVVSFNMELLFVWSLLLVKHKFRRLNEKVRLMMQDKGSKGNKTAVMPSRWMNRQPCYSSEHLAEKIDVISRLHRELRNIIRRIEEHFTPLVLFSVGKNFTYLTLDTYLTYRYLKAHPPPDNMCFVFLGAISHCILSAFIHLFVISDACGSTLNEANNTGNIFHTTLNNNVSYDDTQESAILNLLSLDLLKNRVSISILGLVKLDDFFVYSTVATAITHLTIMLQLYN